MLAREGPGRSHVGDAMRVVREWCRDSLLMPCKRTTEKDSRLYYFKGHLRGSSVL